MLYVLKFSLSTFGSHVFLIATVVPEWCWIRTHRELRSSVGVVGKGGWGVRKLRYSPAPLNVKDRVPFPTPALDSETGVEAAGTETG